MSWTTSLKTATWFAESCYPARFDLHNAIVVTATVGPEYILARFNGRSENEVVLVGEAFEEAEITEI